MNTLTRSTLSLDVDGETIEVRWYGGLTTSKADEDAIRETIRALKRNTGAHSVSHVSISRTDDGYPACPRCGCQPGTYGRLLRTAQGIMCNDCQGYWFERFPEPPR